MGIITFDLKDGASVDQFLEAAYLDMLWIKSLNMFTQVLDNSIYLFFQQDAFGFVVCE